MALHEIPQQPDEQPKGDTLSQEVHGQLLDALRHDKTELTQFRGEVSNVKIEFSNDDDARRTAIHELAKNYGVHELRAQLEANRQELKALKGPDAETASRIMDLGETANRVEPGSYLNALLEHSKQAG